MIDSFLERIIVLGNPGVGKTTLVNRIIGKQLKVLESATQGLEISQWEVDSDNIPIWDFGGQEIYQNSYRPFLANNCLYIVVIDGRNLDEETDLIYWLNEIELSGGNTPTLVVVNKIDITAYELNRRALKENYPFIIGFHSVSAENDMGIAELIDTIKKKITDQQRQRIPENWLEIKKMLLSFPESFIDVTKFKKLCSISGIFGQEENLLIKYFADKGYVFPIKFSAKEEEVLILDIQWLLHGLSIIQRPNSLEVKSRVTKDELTKILIRNDYGNKSAKIILAFAEYIGQIVRLANDRFIIPGLLSKEEPPGAFEPELRKVRLYYSYEFLPRDLGPRLFSKLFPVSMTPSWWQNGIILIQPNASAMVRVDPQLREIQVGITGSPFERKELLAFITATIEDVHKTFSNLKVQKMIPFPTVSKIAFRFDQLNLMLENGITYFPVLDGEKPENINIQELLDEIKTEQKKSKLVKIFIDYSIEDENYALEFSKHLNSLVQAQLISKPDFNSPQFGSEIDYLKQTIRESDILCILITPDLLSIDFHLQVISLALEYSKVGKLKVVPILVRDCAYNYTDLKNFRAIPSNGISITQSKDRDGIWRSVVLEIERMARIINGEIKPSSNLILSRIELENIRCFEHVTIDLTSNKEADMLLLLLGENGVGKTTILKSLVIGLATMSDAAGMLSKMQGDFLTKGENRGQIVIKLIEPTLGTEYEIQTNFEKSSSGELKMEKLASADFPSDKVFLCGYGAGRIGFGTETIENYSIASATATLFDYKSNLQNPELSLRRSESSGVSIDSLARRIDQILMLDPGSTVIDASGMRVNGPWGDFVPVGGLGDGYKATLGWISDLLGWSLLFNSNMIHSDICGIVVIDELEQHLHPRWQRVIIKKLKEQFPKVQFIISTHTPLLASGAVDFENSRLYSLERNIADQKIVTREIKRDQLKGKDASNVLTQAFGMLSTLSLKSVDLFERYAELESAEKLNKEQNSELEQIKQELNIDSTPYIDEQLRSKINRLLE